MSVVAGIPNSVAGVSPGKQGKSSNQDSSLSQERGDPALSLRWVPEGLTVRSWSNDWRTPPAAPPRPQDFQALIPAADRSQAPDLRRLSRGQEARVASPLMPRPRVAARLRASRPRRCRRAGPAPARGSRRGARSPRRGDAGPLLRGIGIYKDSLERKYFQGKALSFESAQMNRVSHESIVIFSVLYNAVFPGVFVGCSHCHLLTL
jgi:hypothetical protein